MEPTSDLVVGLVERVLLRAPALPASLVPHPTPPAPTTPAGRAPGTLPPLLASALALADPDGVRAHGPARARTLLRMAFRPTPAGLLGGVAVGQLGDETRLSTGGAGRAHLHPRWGLLAEVARALLGDEAVRERVRLRVCPSLLRYGERACFLGPGEGGRARTVRLAVGPESEPLVDAVLAVAQQWTPWPTLRRLLTAPPRARGRGARTTPLEPLDPEAADDLLLVLLDDGLLADDLTPPLLGPPPLDHLVDRLARLGKGAPAARAVRDVLAAVQQEAGSQGAGRAADDPSLPDRIAAGIAALSSLPRHGARTGEGHGGPGAGVVLDAVLELQPTAATLSRTAVERAAHAVPSLLRLLAALGPVLERGSAALGRSLATVVEDWGAGRFDLGQLAHSAFGVALGPAVPPFLASDEEAGATGSDEASATRTLPAPLLTRLVERLARALTAPGGGEAVVALTGAELDAALPAVSIPPSLELVLAPCREPPGSAPGTGWLLGLHGPAGSTWGRFAHALGAPLGEAFAELGRAEAEALGPGVTPVDVCFAPSAEVADVACRPVLRPRTLALSAWPAGPPSRALPASALVLTLDERLLVPGLEEAPEALGVATRAGATLAPLPLQRVRAATVEEEGAYRLLVGHGLVRAVAPWALHLGPLAGLARLPRITLDGFVIMPASWALPDGLDEAPGRIAAWRAAQGVPRIVQVGTEDRLLPVDLDAAGAAEELLHHVRGGATRAFEIWPPLDALPDRDGRRVEAVVALLHRSEGATAERPRSRRSRATPPPLVEPRPDPAVTTLKLFGPPEEQDRVLALGVGPAIDELRHEGLLGGWFFQRYVDEGGRHHLRVRLRARTPQQAPPARRRRTRSSTDTAPSIADVLAHLVARMDLHLAPLFASGAVVCREVADYRPERGRFGGPAGLALAEAVFESESELSRDLLAIAPEELPPHGLLLARAFDALGAGTGLDTTADRLALATAHRLALAEVLAGRDAELAMVYRGHQAALQAALRADRAVAAGGRAKVSRRHRDEPHADGLVAPLAAHAARLRVLAKRPGAGPLLAAMRPALLHLCAVRLLGPARHREALGAYLWQRALEGLVARSRSR